MKKFALCKSEWGQGMLLIPAPESGDTTDDFNRNKMENTRAKSTVTKEYRHAITSSVCGGFSLPSGNSTVPV